jgi:hypothetical protein
MNVDGMLRLADALLVIPAGPAANGPEIPDAKGTSPLPLPRPLPLPAGAYSN